MSSTRLPFTLGFLFVAFALSFGFYLQYIDGILPCSLCELQRLAFAAIGILCGIGIFCHRVRLCRIVLYAFMTLFSTSGLLLSGKQIYMQYFPHAESGGCTGSLYYLFEIMPWRAALRQIFMNNADCSKRHWEFLWLDIAEWSFLLFSALFIYSCYELWQQRRTVFLK